MYPSVSCVRSVLVLLRNRPSFILGFVRIAAATIGYMFRPFPNRNTFSSVSRTEFLDLSISSLFMFNAMNINEKRV